jgi:hypothetical protein
MLAAGRKAEGGVESSSWWGTQEKTLQWTVDGKTGAEEIGGALKE